MREASKINAEAQGNAKAGKKTVAVNSVSELDDKELAKLLNEVIALNPFTVCEVGFKVGDNLLTLRNLLPEATIHGVEFNPILENYANIHNSMKHQDITVETVYGAEFWDHDVKYDVVFCYGLFDEISSREADILLDKMCRLSKHVYVDNRSSMNDQDIRNGLGHHSPYFKFVDLPEEVTEGIEEALQEDNPPLTTDDSLPLGLTLSDEEVEKALQEISDFGQEQGDEEENPLVDKGILGLVWVPDLSTSELTPEQIKEIQDGFSDPSDPLDPTPNEEL